MELPACPVETTLMLIGDKRKVLILRDLMDGTKRFGELKKSIGHVTQKVLMENIHALNADEKVHGVLMFRPLPGHLDDEAARAALDPKKDMDGITDGSMTAVYAGK